MTALSSHSAASPTFGCRAGFTLLETMIAIVVLAIGIVGVLMGFGAAAESLRRGQLRQYEAMLVSARSESLMSANKINLTNTTGLPSTPADGGIPSAGWVPDPTPATTTADGGYVLNDVAGGAYFKVIADGEITNLALSGNPSCGGGLIPAGIYCREIILTQGSSSSLGVGGTPYTYYTRVSRSGDPSSVVVQADEFVE